MARKFGARKKIQADDPVSLGEQWGLPPRIWHEDWSQASGGEGQRAMLAIAVCLKPDILLLDEPTSYVSIRGNFTYCGQGVGRGVGPVSGNDAS